MLYNINVQSGDIPLQIGLKHAILLRTIIRNLSFIKTSMFIGLNGNSIHGKKNPKIILVCKNKSALVNKGYEMKKRNKIFKKKGYSTEYRRARNTVVNMIRKAKSNYL